MSWLENNIHVEETWAPWREQREILSTECQEDFKNKHELAELYMEIPPFKIDGEKYYLWVKWSNLLTGKNILINLSGSILFGDIDLLNIFAPGWITTIDWKKYIQTINRSTYYVSTDTPYEVLDSKRQKVTDEKVKARILDKRD